MASALHRGWQHFRRTVPAYVVLAIALIGTAVTTGYVAENAREADERRFGELIDSTNVAISRRLDEHLSALYGARAMLVALGRPDRTAFREYVANLDLGHRSPGVQGVGVAVLLAPDQVEAHQARVRAEGFPRYEVWPKGPRPEYSAIIFLEPFDERNQRAFGYDMYSEPVRHEAMQRARITGEPSASGKVELVQEFGAHRQPGFLVYLPMFEAQPGGAAPPPELVGWVYAPFRAYDFFRGIFGDRPSGGDLIDFEIYDSEPEPKRLLYDHDPASDARAAGASAIQRLVPVDIAGRRWVIAFAAAEEFMATSPRESVEYWVAIGLIISVLLFAIARSQVLARETAEERQRRTQFIAEAGRLLSESLNYETTLDHVASLCIGALGDWCVIELLDEHGQPHDVALAHRDPEQVSWAREVRKVRPRDPNSGALAVIRSGKPERVNALPQDVVQRVAADPEAAAILQRARIGSYLIVPLISRGRAIGAISLVSEEPGRYGDEDTATALDLARLAAAAVDNARSFQAAQQAVRIRDEFLSIASHELKTPLTSMSLKLQMLKRIASTFGGEHQDRRLRSLEVLERQMVRLTRLINSLLDISRLAAGKLNLELADMDLSQLAREVAASLHDEAALAGCPLEVNAPDPVVGRWDRLRLEQVLSNLLSNAIKYGHDHPVSLRVDGTADRATVTVVDRGIGIAAEDLNRVFDRFERAAPAANYGGLGLGLYISKQIVDALGGHITVTSKAGEGSTFVFDLPRAGPPSTVQRPSGAGAPMPNPNVGNH